MGSSAKKKREKKKDFQKPKFKVGKAKPKAANFTDTSFSSKTIALPNQSITTNAPAPSTQITHHLSLLSSHSSAQRRDSLIYLTTALTSRVTAQALPIPLSTLFPKTLPLLSDPSASVRSSVLKLLRNLPVPDLDAHVPTLLLHIRAGLTHLALDIRLDALEALHWLLDVQGDETVACEGGWIKTLKCFLAMLGWERGEIRSAPGKWSRAPKASFSRVGEGEGKVVVKALSVLGEFLKAGLLGIESVDTDAEDAEQSSWPLWQVEMHGLPQKKNAFARLNLFGDMRGEAEMMYEDREDRVAAFVRLGFKETVSKGLEAAKREAGEVGRAAAGVLKILGEAMENYEG